MDDAVLVRQRHLLDWQAHGDQQVYARQGGCAGAGRHQLYVLDPLVLQHQAIVDCGRHDDGRAVLIVMEHRDAHAGPQLTLDLKALGRLDILEVDGAKRWFERGHDFDEQRRVGRVDLDIEDVDTGELLEEHGLALHHGLTSERPDIAEAQHGGPVADDRDQVAARRQVPRGVRVGDDGLTRGGNAW